jgi:hypothetical protein
VLDMVNTHTYRHTRIHIHTHTHTHTHAHTHTEADHQPAAPHIPPQVTDRLRASL